MKNHYPHQAKTSTYPATSPTAHRAPPLPPLATAATTLPTAAPSTAPPALGKLATPANLALPCSSTYAFPMMPALLSPSPALTVQAGNAWPASTAPTSTQL